MESEMPPKNEEKSLLDQIISHTVVGIVCASITFGMSEMQSSKARATELVKVTGRMQAIEERLHEESVTREKADVECTAAITRLSSRLDKLIDLCTQLLATIHANQK